MNDTKWDELRLGMYELGDVSPRWRTRTRRTGYVSNWDREWFYHFREGGYDTIEWVEIATSSSDQHRAVLEVLRRVHVPGEETETGFRVFGYAQAGQAIDYL